MTSTTYGEQGSAKKGHYSISLFSDKGGGRGKKNLKKWVTGRPLCTITELILTLILLRT